MIKIQTHLPDGFFEEEVRCEYTITKKMKEIWGIEIDLLNEFDRVCKKHSIKYFADGGTILGAVRHKGFIPWDDDIDLALTRDEYTRLCNVSYEFKDPYFFQTEYTDPGSLKGHAQLRNSNTTAILKGDYKKNNLFKYNQGIFIDIFPIDKVIDNNELFALQAEQIKSKYEFVTRWSNLTSRYRKGDSIGVKGTLKDILHHILKVTHIDLIIGKRAYKKFELLCQKYNENNTRRCSLLSYECSWKRLIRDCDDYKKSVLMPFEHLYIPVPIGYKHVLRNLYGDYQKIIINNSAHGDIIFDTDVSYKNFTIDEGTNND